MLRAMAPLTAFLAALTDVARPRFDDDAALAAVLDRILASARAAYPEVAVADAHFVAELARRLGDDASPELLARVRGDHVYLATACAAGDDGALRRLDAEFLDEVEQCAARLRATPDQAAETRSHLRRILFVSEPGRPAAAHSYSGKGDLRAYVRVIATRELVRVVNKGRREVGVEDDVLDLLSPAHDPELIYLRELYRADVDAAMRAALVGLGDQSRALLRYHLLDGWSIDRIGALYGVHRATAARWIAAARQELGEGIRAEVARRLAISVDDVASIVRLVQSRIDVSLARLLA